MKSKYILFPILLIGILVVVVCCKKDLIIEPTKKKNAIPENTVTGIVTTPSEIIEPNIIKDTIAPTITVPGVIIPKDCVLTRIDNLAFKQQLVGDWGIFPYTFGMTRDHDLRLTYDLWLRFTTDSIGILEKVYSTEEITKPVVNVAYKIFGDSILYAPKLPGVLKNRYQFFNFFKSVGVYKINHSHIDTLKIKTVVPIYNIPPNPNEETTCTDCNGIFTRQP